MLQRLALTEILKAYIQPALTLTIAVKGHDSLSEKMITCILLGEALSSKR